MSDESNPFDPLGDVIGASIAIMIVIYIVLIILAIVIVVCIVCCICICIRSYSKNKSVPQIVPPGGPIMCKRCHSMIAYGERFCPGCGRAIEYPGVPQPMVQPMLQQPMVQQPITTMEPGETTTGGEQPPPSYQP